MNKRKKCCKCGRKATAFYHGKVYCQDCYPGKTTKKDKRNKNLWLKNE